MLDKYLTNDSRYIPHFINGDITQFNVDFEHFRTLSQFTIHSDLHDDGIKNIQLMNAASGVIHMLKSSQTDFESFCSNHHDLLAQLTADEIGLTHGLSSNLSYTLIDVVNLINPKSLMIYDLKEFFDSFQAIKLLNCSNLEIIYGNDDFSNLELQF